MDSSKTIEGAPESMERPLDLKEFRKIIFATKPGQSSSRSFVVLKKKKGRLVPRECIIRYARDTNGTFLISITHQNESLQNLTYTEFLKTLEEAFRVRKDQLQFQENVKATSSSGAESQHTGHTRACSKTIKTQGSERELVVRPPQSVRQYEIVTPQRLSDVSEKVARKERLRNAQAHRIRQARIAKENAQELKLINEAGALPKNSPLKNEGEKLHNYITQLVENLKNTDAPSHENTGFFLSQITRISHLKTAEPAPEGGHYLVPTIAIHIERNPTRDIQDSIPLEDYRSILKDIMSQLKNSKIFLDTPQFRKGHTTLKMSLYWNEKKSARKGRGLSREILVNEKYFISPEGTGNEIVNYNLL
ncbi:hypothetical protein COU15_01970 [Candidatus Kaiserbacteria bacterium CG10_big_fil_rev_8_21_14_0_10_45_20]|uniref:Uncharacterized protein n=1 Tax=Candidatus Kaiserbacteria bacterium CG10_big_fil_rev_8_21_14_0_10_45_20 TaxID=1974607 RepID=A0A2H0UFF6_9BACT|nr:MAG: hypothetical protein COU15_01970 [Candidatus Kaiserbacteria bacterium CG10_big_fil_rev_8_21_14_0_10_45_20]